MSHCPELGYTPFCKTVIGKRNRIIMGQTHPEVMSGNQEKGGQLPLRDRASWERDIGGCL